MCAMALVHSRVRRVVFAFPDSKRGMLGAGRTDRRLHCEKSLNHRYIVFCLCDTAVLEGNRGAEEGGEKQPSLPCKRARE